MANKINETFTTPVSANDLEIGTNGLFSTGEQMDNIDGLSNCEMSIEGTLQEYFTTLNGYNSADKTAIKLSFSISGKRVVGNKGNDYIARTAWYIGKKAKTLFNYTFDDGMVMSGRLVVNVSKNSGGAAEDDNGLEADLVIDGKPTIKMLTDITVTKTTKSYVKGHAIDTSDVKVMATYSDGSTKDVSKRAELYTDGVDIMEAGSYEMQVEYCGYYDVIDITITDVEG